MRKVLIPVIGMHRAGTSATAGALQRLGCDLGPADRLMPASPSNPRGHFENLDVVALHDRLLAKLGCSWDDPPMPSLAENHDGEALLRARKWLSQLNGPGPFAVKDPRMTLFPNLWEEAARDTFELRPLWVERNPDAIYASLQHRDGAMTRDRFASIYFRYLNGVDAWDDRVGIVSICFEDLISDPRRWTQVLVRDLRLPPPATYAGAIVFLDKGLVHHG